MPIGLEGQLRRLSCCHEQNGNREMRQAVRRSLDRAKRLEAMTTNYVSRGKAELPGKKVSPILDVVIFQQ